MMGSNRRAATVEAITRATRSAGGLVIAALVLSAAALLMAAVALITAVKR